MRKLEVLRNVKVFCFEKIKARTATAALPSISTTISSSSTRWVRRLHRQRNYRERNLIFNRMVQAGVNINDNSGSQDSNDNVSSTTSTTTQRNTSSTTNSQLQDDDQNIRSRSKAVCKLNCTYCESRVCLRGMKAMLLADTRVELYSTDVPPLSVQLVGEDYLTQNCHCKIRDVACLTCGNVLGYHITQPCQQCMDACNNGHLWMFHTEEVTSEERLDFNGNTVLLWTHLSQAEGVENMNAGEDEYEN
ncbi:15088_t:CDS:2, partial [Racocetra persica]